MDQTPDGGENAASLIVWSRYSVSLSNHVDVDAIEFRLSPHSGQPLRMKGRYESFGVSMSSQKRSKREAIVRDVEKVFM